ncbi:FAD-dependent oxidoreductase [Algoriphagus chordae]|uniref:Phytoene dehydrogenase-like protein n=1 Tax=Algoriphagus chordae TaxID=237019 RepID=A0A2W7R409_9BACT|nr:FAD-dependent oxidoreductase [Algoriphagus chordae]PZX55568.1 phytoene dehydrogenase-like protein [Algoriphagus chordae]
MSKEFDVIIIGGGLGGLTAGATLSKQGKKVLLLEQHYIAGGCATTFKRKEFILEVGLHELDGLYEKDSKQDIFKFLEVDKHVEFVQIPELFRLKGNGIDFTHPHGQEAAALALIEKFPNEEKGIRSCLEFMDKVFTEIPKFPRERWVQLLLYPMLPLLYPNTVKAAKTNLGDWLDKHIADDELKIIMQAMLLYYHDDPYSMSMTYFSAAQASYIGGGGYFVKGGSQNLSNYLKSVIEQSGGQVLLGKKASEIITKDGKAIGVKFKDNFNEAAPETSQFAQAIIANAAVPLVKDLLPPAESEKLGKKIDALEKYCALLTVYIGFKKEVKDLGNKHYSTFVVGDDVKTLHDIKANNLGDWKNRNFVFVDYSQVDSKLAPQGKSVGVICAADYLTDWDKLDKEAYASRKEEVAQILFKRLEKEIPGICEQIEYYEVGTSKTVQRYTLNPGGTPYGFAQTPKQSGMGRLPLKSPIKNLYFAGAWSMPGGGFTGAIISGFLCGNTVNKRLNKNSNTQPVKLVDDRIVKLISKTVIAENTLELRIEKPKGFEYIAGQYAVLEILDPAHRELDTSFRSLSMVSHPDEDELRFSMRLSNTSFKQSINQLAAQHQFRVFGPMGDFLLSDNKKGIVFLISGIGITPVLPFLKELEKSKFDQPVFLFYSNKTSDEAAYHETFKAATLLSFQYIPVFTKIDSRINNEFLQAKLKDLTAFDYYVVGTKGFLNSMKAILLQNNVPLENIKIDDFG